MYKNNHVKNHLYFNIDMSQMLGLPCQALAVTGSDWLCAQSESVIRVKTRNNQTQESGKCFLFL